MAIIFSSEVLDVVAGYNPVVYASEVLDVVIVGVDVFASEVADINVGT